MSDTLTTIRRFAGLLVLAAAMFTAAAQSSSAQAAGSEIGPYAPASVYCNEYSNKLQVKAQVGLGSYYGSQTLAYRIWAYDLTRKQSFWLRVNNGAGGAWTPVVHQRDGSLFASASWLEYTLADGSYHVYIEYLWWSSVSNRWLPGFTGSLRTPSYGNYGSVYGACIL